MKCFEIIWQIRAGTHHPLIGDISPMCRSRLPTIRIIWNPGLTEGVIKNNTEIAKKKQPFFIRFTEQCSLEFHSYQRKVKWLLFAVFLITPLYKNSVCLYLPESSSLLYTLPPYCCQVASTTCSWRCQGWPTASFRQWAGFSTSSQLRIGCNWATNGARCHGC